jgi:membrane associated rhomboid family serine protease
MTAQLARDKDRSLAAQTGAAVKTVTGGAAALWAIELVDLVLGGALDGLGIAPHTLNGLLRIPLAPFLHAGITHLAMNTVPFIVLGLLTMTRSRKDFWVVTAATALTSGLGAWVFGASGSIHLGASGVIFGYLGFLMFRGLFERRLAPALLSLGVTWLFGSMLYLAIPFVTVGVSWQAHLFGFLGGVLVSRILGRQLRAQKSR